MAALTAPRRICGRIGCDISPPSGRASFGDPAVEVGLAADQGKAGGNGFELVGGGEAALAEALQEDATDRRDEGRAPSEEHALHLVRPDAGAAERLVQCAGD